MSFRNNFYLLAVGAYVAILLFNYLRYDTLFQFSLGLTSLLILPPVLFFLYRRHQSQDFLRKWTPLLVILLSYEALQGVAGTMVSQGGVLSLYAYDKALWGVNLTVLIQQTYLSPSLTSLALFLYSLHFPLVVGTSLFLWFAKRELYTKYVLAISATSFIALIAFIVVPTAPPWYSGVAENIVNAAINSNAGSAYPAFLVGYMHMTSLIESDKFAAFPSLHGEYAVLFCYFVMRFRFRLGLIAIPLTFGILFSTVYLGQHYVIDLLAGGALAIASCVVAELILSRPALMNKNLTMIEHSEPG